MDKAVSYDVVEIFDSVNGEGLNAGKLATFVRLKGCNLRCSYCDTLWANKEDVPYMAMSSLDILRRIEDSDFGYVTITGGEPLLAPDIVPLLKQIGQGRHIDIETNGSVCIETLVKSPLLEKVHLIMDYKLPSSGMMGQMYLDNFKLLRAQDTVKFVVGSQEDLEEALRVMATYALAERCHVFFSPVFGSIAPEEIVAFMKVHQLKNVVLQLQLHKIIWDPQTKGV